jgi:predicted dienelactone hydrolase
MSDIRALSGIVMLAATVLLALPAGAKTYQTVSPDGPLPVGVRVQSVAMPNRTAPALVWYPAQPGTGAGPCLYNTDVRGHALLNAEPDRSSAPYPLIVFSHGMGGCAPQHVFFNENLASYGYVVVAPDHEEGAMCHIEGPPEIGPARMSWVTIKHALDLSGVVMDLFGEMMKQRQYDFSYRPAEIKATLDSALQWNQADGHFLRGLIDPARIGMAGHSLGGFTTLMIGGMPFLCDGKKPAADQCNLDHVGLRNVPDPCCFDYVSSRDPYYYRDPRIKAMLIMSPAILYSHLPEAAAKIQIPIMIINGDKTFEVPWEPLQTIYDHAPAPKYLVRLKQVDHMTAADSTMTMSAARLVLPGLKSHFPEKAQAYKDLSADFFNLYLKGDQSAAAKISQTDKRFVIMQAQP